MTNKYEIQPISTTSAGIEVLEYEQVESQRDAYGILRLPDGNEGNVLIHQVEASKDGFLTDFPTTGGFGHPLIS